MRSYLVRSEGFSTTEKIRFSTLLIENQNNGKNLKYLCKIFLELVNCNRELILPLLDLNRDKARYFAMLYTFTAATLLIEVY